jgi:nucleoside-diphosphate-sugar epimerase
LNVKRVIILDNLSSGCGVHGLDSTIPFKEEAIGEAINLGSGEDQRVIDMANTVNELTGNEEGIAYVARRNWDAKTKLLSSIEKAKSILGYKPKMEFKSGLKKTHKWFVENWSNIKESTEF